jgi:hypothetical protein
MTVTTHSHEARDLHDAREAARALALAHFNEGMQFSRGDARNGLRYLLMRLSLLGLTEEDRTELRELGRLTTQHTDAAELAGQIAARATASPLAVAIATLVQRGGGDRDPAMILFGAVFGAYAALDVSSGGDPKLRLAHVVQAASAGAVAAATVRGVEAEHERTCWQLLVQKD